MIVQTIVVIAYGTATLVSQPENDVGGGWTPCDMTIEINTSRIFTYVNSCDPV